MRVLVTYRSMSTCAGRVRNGDIVDLPEEEVRRILKTKPRALQILPELPLEKPKPAPKKRAPAKRKTVAKKVVDNVKPNDND